jgi:membrane dipeptidase
MSDAIATRRARLMRDAVVCDMTLPWGNWEEGKDEILPRYAAAGVHFVSLSVGLDRIPFDETVRAIARERARFRASADRIVLVDSVAGIRAARDQGKLAVGFHFQGSNGLGGMVEMLEVYYRLGVRQMLLAYNQRNQAADGCSERTDSGLSRFGVRLVEEMNRLGMVPDCTHMGYRSSMDVLEMSRGPVLFSHSNSKALVAHDRNITDEQMRACARSGGVVGITGVGHFLSTGMVATVEDFVRHLDYAAALIGPDHVGLGVDHVYYLGHKAKQRAAAVDMYPQGYPPAGTAGSYLGPEDVPRIVDRMIAGGWSDADIHGVLGANYLRVCEQVWR